MKEITVKIYPYKELSSRAKQTARNWFYNGIAADLLRSAWADMQEEAAEIGLKLTSIDHDRAKGKFKLEPFQVLELIIYNHDKKRETYKLAKKLKKQYDQLTTDDFNNGALEILHIDTLSSLLKVYEAIWEQKIEYIYSEACLVDNTNNYQFFANGTIFNDSY